MQWINYPSLPDPNKDVVIKYNGNEMEIGQRNQVIDLYENGWEDVRWLDESPLSAESGEQDASDKIEKFINECRKETGAGKGLIVEAFTQNNYKFDKEFVINFVRIHGPKF